MLQLVLGIAGSGKTGRLLQCIGERAQKGAFSVLLVPEQYSSAAEALVYNTLGDAGSALVEVVSFRTLAERIFRFGGGPAQPVLSDAGRVVYLRRALDAIADDLQSYARHRSGTAFLQSCADVLSEFKTAGATPQRVREIGIEAREAKLVELALVFEAYESVLANSALDPQDRLLHAAARAGCGYFENKACFVDNFDGFTSPEYTLVQAVLQHAQSLTVALCCDGMQETDGGLGLFSPVRKTAARLVQLAAKAEVRCGAPLVLPAYEGVHGAASSINLLLAAGELPQTEAEKRGLTLTAALDEWDEVRCVAAEMHRLAHEGVPYSRMAVICRDLSEYERAVRREFGLFDIPYFTDATATPEYTAPVAFLRAALGVLKSGISTAPVLALLKTGLCGYGEEAVAELENYAFVWSPKAAEWREPLAKNPAGLMTEETPETRRRLALAEGVRADLVPRLEHFRRRCRGGSAEAVAKGVYLLMESFDAGDHLDAMAARLEAAGDIQAADECRRAWDVAMGLLDEMALLLGNEKLDAAAFDDMLLLLVRTTEFGTVPQTLECAVFTAADRMRLDGPDYCFVLGLYEGGFPASIGYSGLLTHADRDLLVQGGVEMPGSFENRVLLEEMVLYRALTSAKKGLYLSWPKRLGGAAKAMSAALEPVSQAYAPPALQPPVEALAATPAAAFDRLGEVYRENSREAAALYAALQAEGGADRLQVLNAVENAGGFAVEDTATLHRLVGDTLTLSATRAERYFSCRFSYYMERVLRVQPRRKAELSPMESGTFVHHVLEQVVKEAGEGFPEISDEALADMAARHADVFIEEFLPGDSRRMAHLLEQIKAATTKLLCFLRDAAAQSEFSIDAVELPIGDGEGDIPPLEVTLPTGERVRVRGQIDRVDVLRRGEDTYLCVVDYKTGSKKFDLNDVYCGLNMQMMIYLQTLLQNGGERYPNAKAAGVLYLTGDPAPASGKRQAAEGVAFSMDGILLDDAGVLVALDAGGEGRYLPVKHKNGKGVRAGKKLANAEKLGRIARHVEDLLGDMAKGVYGGDFAARPLVKREERPCKWCAYRAACRHEDGRFEAPVTAPEGAFEPPAEEVVS